VEARTLLKDICHQKDLASRPFVLIFNKMDLFVSSLHTKPLSVCKVFQGVEGKGDNEPHEAYAARCTDYVVQYFEKAVNSSDDPKTKHQCLSYMTSATDTKIFLNVMEKALLGTCACACAYVRTYVRTYVCACVCVGSYRFVFVDCSARVVVVVVVVVVVWIGSLISLLVSFLWTVLCSCRCCCCLDRISDLI
jgi:hypothetical protein